MKTLRNSALIFATKPSPITPQIEEFLKDRKAYFETTNNVQKALDFITTDSPCLVIFDTPTDDPKALDLCKKLKKLKEESRFNIYFLIDNNSNLEEQLNWFKNGVDEFGTRDTNSILICQRIRNILAKYEDNLIDVIPQKGIVIDSDRYLVYKNGKEIFLPRKEFELLQLLNSRPTKVFTRDEIFRHVWGNRSIVGDRTIDVHIRKIREKIGSNHIVTVKGVGYKFIG